MLFLIVIIVFRDGDFVVKEGSICALCQHAEQIRQGYRVLCAAVLSACCDTAISGPGSVGAAMLSQMDRGAVLVPG